MKAALLYHQKVTVTNSRNLQVAICELKVWEVPISKNYPDGVKYSLFLVSKETGTVLVGFDNHGPKGAHLHRDGKEAPYHFKGVDEVIDDFWKLVKEEGFNL